MTVVDTGPLVDLLCGASAGDAVAEVLLAERRLHCADLATFEVLAVLRRRVLVGQLSEVAGEDALQALADLPIRRFDVLPLLSTAWRWRQNLTAADALVLALAEDLGETLLTSDAKLAAAAKTLAPDVRVRLG